MRVKVIMACDECKNRNYHTFKNKQNNPDRIYAMIFDRWEVKFRVNGNILEINSLNDAGRFPESTLVC